MGSEGKGYTAREYLRVSLDKSGRERSIDEQHQEIERAAAEHGWILGAPYRDTGSASRHATKARSGFDRLIADLETDRFGADLLVLWESSRGSRKVREWVELVELCEERAVKIAVTTHGRTYDPANPRDRRSLLEDAADSEYESAKMSVRAKRAAAAGAAAGAPHGRTPYGYVRRHDERTGRFTGQEIHEPEAVIVRELFDRLRRGHSLRAISTDLEARGVRTRSGRVFSPQHLRDLATKRLYVGERVHGKEITPAAWPPIVDRRVWLAVHHILTDPARKTTRPGRAVHLLSMIAVCDICSGPMAVTFRRQRPEYICRTGGHVRLDRDELDTITEAVIVGFLQRPDNVARLTAGGGDGRALARARGEIAEIRAELDDLADQVGRGDLSATLAARAEPAIVARLRAAETREADLSTPSQLRDLISPGADVARRWKAAPMSAKRTVARMLLVPEILGELRVGRSATPGHRVPVGERVRWRT